MCVVNVPPASTKKIHHGQVQHGNKSASELHEGTRWWSSGWRDDRQGTSWTRSAFDCCACCRLDARQDVMLGLSCCTILDRKLNVLLSKTRRAYTSAKLDKHQIDWFMFGSARQNSRELEKTLPLPPPPGRILLFSPVPVAMSPAFCGPFASSSTSSSSSSESSSNRYSACQNRMLLSCETLPIQVLSRENCLWRGIQDNGRVRKEKKKDQKMGVKKERMTKKMTRCSTFSFSWPILIAQYSNTGGEKRERTTKKRRVPWPFFFLLASKQLDSRGAHSCDWLMRLWRTKKIKRRWMKMRQKR